MTNQEELESLYIKVGTKDWKDNGKDLERIWELEKLISPPEIKEEIEENWEPVCGSSICNGRSCWECAAIRGGCPEDV